MEVMQKMRMSESRMAIAKKAIYPTCEHEMAPLTNDRHVSRITHRCQLSPRRHSIRTGGRRLMVQKA